MCGGEAFLYTRTTPAALTRLPRCVAVPSFVSLFFSFPFPLPLPFFPPFSCRAYVCRGGLDLKFNDAIHATEASPAVGNTILLSHI